MRIASRWAKTGSLKVLGDTQHPWQHVLRLGHIQATRRCRGMRDRAVWQAVWNSAVFRCISLYDAPYMYHASSRLPPGAIQPYSAIQRCMSIQLYSTIQHTAHTTPLRSFEPQKEVSIIPPKSCRRKLGQKTVIPAKSSLDSTRPVSSELIGT